MTTTAGRIVRATWIGLAVLGVATSTALAQGAPSARPYRGLFGAGTPPTSNGQLFDLNATFYGEHGVDPRGLTTTDGDEVVQREGWFGGIRAGATYRKRTRRAQFGASVEGSGRYYEEDRRWTDPGYRAEMGLDMSYGRQASSRFSVGGGYEFQPYYTIPLLQGSSAVTDGAAIQASSRDDLLFRQDRHIVTGTLRLEQGMGRRGVWLVEASGRNTTSPEPLYEARDLRVGGGLGYRIGRYATARVGYAFQRGEYGYLPNAPLNSHIIDVGIDYRRPLPRLRRTTLSVTTGSGIYDTVEGHHTRLSGAVSLRHDFEKGWFIRTDYTRDVRMVEGFTAPFLSDGVTGSLGGFFGRRIEVLTTGGYASGHVGFSGDRYEVVQASARLRVALSRYLALDAEGLAFKYDFAATDVSLTPLAPTYERRSIRVQLTMWLPVGR